MQNATSQRPNVLRCTGQRLPRVTAAKYEAASSREPYKGHATANGAMAALRAIWNFMADRVDGADDPPRNPVMLRGQWHTVKERERYPRDGDLPAFYRATMALENPVARDYILLILFTGLRRREASSLRWKEDIDLQGRIIHISATNTKSSKKLDLPMSDIVHNMLVVRRGVGDTKYVFPAESASGYIEEPKFYFQQIADASGIRVSVHDLRRTFLTHAESCDISSFALQALVNHSLGRGVTAKYIRMTAERLREPVQRVADKIKQLCGVREPHGENVARMR
jgi:integrase